ncbi:MAG TPA: aldose epimerase family protein [Opitutaceae bacterium]|nr:aldose epimerase family protein [Opitutaceae bacterium]HRJ46330.1 aldose epimerase family protein [Opitutaceae bacterium]
MTPAPFGRLLDGQPVAKYTLRNAAGASADVITYGGIITALRMPDRHGKFADVVLGFDRLDAYVAGHPYFGAIIGRIAGRVSAGRLQLPDGVRQLALTDGPNHLHGGRVGFDKRIWSVLAASPNSLRLFYRSPDGEESYPGNLDVTVTYTLTDRNELVVESEAVSDRVTPLSLAQHSYFNLAGEGSGDVLGHEVQIHAGAVIPAADDAMTLSGRLAPVAGTGNDFRQARRLGEALPGLFKAHGEHYFLRATTAAEPAPVARVTEPVSGRVLEVSTNDCALQFYTGVSLDGTLTGKAGRIYHPHHGLCLECQGYPDGAHRPELGDILVHPGRPQKRITIYAFSTT